MEDHNGSDVHRDYLRHLQDDQMAMMQGSHSMSIGVVAGQPNAEASAPARASAKQHEIGTPDASQALATAVPRAEAIAASALARMAGSPPVRTGAHRMHDANELLQALCRGRRV